MTGVQMPLFEYKCNHCGGQFEKLVTASRRDEVECKFCGSEDTDRQISSFAAQSSGGGGSVSQSAAPSIPRFS
jgi:putative FmdB family regulatory protein